MDKTLFIHQSNYVKRIIDRFKMGDAKPVSVPADPHAILYAAKSDEEIITNVPYRETVGSLTFLAVVSRPDIAFAVSLVSKYLNSHTAAYWKAVKRIFSYQVGAKDLGILYKSGRNESELVGYCDADYAGDTETCRSTIGYAFSVVD